MIDAPQDNDSDDGMAPKEILQRVRELRLRSMEASRLAMVHRERMKKKHKEVTVIANRLRGLNARLDEWRSSAD